MFHTLEPFPLCIVQFFFFYINAIDNRITKIMPICYSNYLQNL